MTMMMVMKG